MPKIDATSLLIGMALGYLVLPRIVGKVAGALAARKVAAA